jgi:hypothetical protein
VGEAPLKKKKLKFGAHIDLDEKMIFCLQTWGVLPTVHLLGTSMVRHRERIKEKMLRNIELVRQIAASGRSRTPLREKQHEMMTVKIKAIC